MTQAETFLALIRAGSPITIYEFDAGCTEDQDDATEIHTTTFSDGSRFHIDPNAGTETVS